jgi:hypothetical protein
LPSVIAQVCTRQGVNEYLPHASRCCRHRCFFCFFPNASLTLRQSGGRHVARDVALAAADAARAERIHTTIILLLEFGWVVTFAHDL